MEPDVRDQVVDFVNRWSDRTGINVGCLIRWVGISRSKYFSWRQRYGKINEHNALIPRDFWLTQCEELAILQYYNQHSTEGYRRLAYMMLDANVVAVSPSSVYRVLKKAGVMRKWDRRDSKKGSGFEQPLKAHEHWHVDVSYLNIRGTFYYLCTILDGYSRAVVHHEIREQMKEMDVELVLERAKEKNPGMRPRIISDNGSQFIALDFKEFIRVSGMDHVRTSRFYPQSNGKIERWHKTIKSEAIRPKCPLSLADGRRIVAEFVDHYNTQRLHSAIGYVTPADKLAGRETEIFVLRGLKLATARALRAQMRWMARTSAAIKTA